MMPTLGNVIARRAAAGETAVRLIRATLDWLDARLKLGAAIRETAAHPVPARLGELVVRLRQRRLDALPPPDRHRHLPRARLRAVGRRGVPQPPGPEPRAAARLVPARASTAGARTSWSRSSCIHMAQVFLFGAFKYPRELTWMVGVVLLVVTLGMAFTGPGAALRPGRLLGPRDPDLDRGARASDRRPLVQIVLGGPIIAGETLTRFFALHVFVIPGLLIGFVGVHLLDGAEARHQRVPDAGPARRQEHVRRRVRGHGPQGRRAVRAGGVPEGPRLLRAS